MLQGRYFKIIFFISLLAVLALPLYSGLYLFPKSKNILLKQIEIEARQLAKHLSSTFTQKNVNLSAGSLPEEIIREIQIVTDDFDMYMLKIFSATGTTVYSSNPSNTDISLKGKEADSDNIFFKNRPVTSIVTTQQKNTEDSVVTMDVARAYVPILDNNNFTGAIEVYYDITNAMKQFNSLKIKNFVISISCSLVLLAIILISLRNAGRYMTELQHESIERKHAKKLLEDKTVYLDSILRSSTDVGIIATDLDFHINYHNYEAARIFGFNSREVFKKTTQDVPLLKMIDREMFFQAIEQVKAHSKHSFTARLNGNREPIHVNITVSAILDNTNRFNGFLIMAQDVTEQKRAEDEQTKMESKLIRAQKMESIGIMAGGVAHDLNNILSGIVSYPGLLLMDVPKDSASYEAVKTIKEAGERAAAVVDDLLAIARGVANVRIITNMNDVINEYLNSAEYRKLMSRHPRIKVTKKLDPQLLSIKCSPIHISKVVMNLVTNSVEAIEKKGTVHIEATNRYLDTTITGYDNIRIGEYVVLIVSDDGPGILADDLERIFEPFYSKKVMGRSGTGLGLAVVWNTVLDHEGYINVASDENGTTFELYFPASRHKPVQSNEEEISLDELQGNGEKILVIDDEKHQRFIIKSLLVRFGYDVITVSNGEEAVEYLDNHSVDLLVLDMIMAPHMNGCQTYEQIIKKHPGQKAIISSGYAENAEVRRAQELGAGPYLKKPFTMEQIGKAVRDELKR